MIHLALSIFAFLFLFRVFIAIVDAWNSRPRKPPRKEWEYEPDHGPLVFVVLLFLGILPNIYVALFGS